MSDIFDDDFGQTEELSSGIFGDDIEKKTIKHIETDTRSGETADIFGSKNKSESKPEIKIPKPGDDTKEEKPVISAADKFKAAAERSNINHNAMQVDEKPAGKRTLQPTTQAGKRTIQPKQQPVQKEVSVKEAVTKVTHDVAQRQSDNRQQRVQQQRNQRIDPRAQQAQGVQKSAQQTQKSAQQLQREQAQRERRARNKQVSRQLKDQERQRQQEIQEMQRQALHSQELQHQQEQQRIVQQQRQQRLAQQQRQREQKSMEIDERPLPQRPLKKKKIDLPYRVVEEVPTSCPGGGAGFLKRFFVGSLNGLKCMSIERKFKNAKEYKCKPFKFKIYNGEAMIVSYSGNARVVEFPSYIRAKSGERIPVCYIHSKCLYDNIFKNYKTKNAIENLTSMDSSFKLNGKNSIIDIKLPEGLKAIFDDTFDNCMDITSLTIPSTVQFIGNKAFRGSTISKLFFNGEPISNWTADLFPGMNIYVKEEYADLY